jgi:murein DD-endopeptidase MepM/ murein hydrolase activator NlpD
MSGGAGAMAMLALAGGCGAHGPEEGEEIASGETLDVGETSAAVVVGTYSTNGQTLTVHDLGAMSVFTSRIASCSDGVLYSTRTDGTLWVNLTDGVGGWTQVTAGAPGTKIACDRLHIYALDADGTLWHATTRSSGQLNVPKDANNNPLPVWSSSGYVVPAGTTEIGSGLGNIYALKYSAGGSTLWSSAMPDWLNDDHYQAEPGSWIQHASNLGTKLVAGAGTLALKTPAPYPSSRPENRVYGMNPDGTLYYNDTVLEGQNWWTSMPNDGVTATAITVDAPNVMYSVVPGSSGIFDKRLYRYEFKESNCTDGVDNDANGMMDAEDPVCRSKLANSYCNTHVGTFCMKRLQNTAGYNNTLVTCSGGAATLSDGVCIEAASAGTDYLKPASQIYTPEPANSGHYCNVIASDGTWGFDWTGSTPCSTLLAQKPGATIVRAGIYSKTATNSILIKCNNGGLLWEATGTQALIDANAGVGHTNNKCVVTVSPKEMRVFNAPFPTNTWLPDSVSGARGYDTGHTFDHAIPCEANDANCPCGASGASAKNCSFNLADFGKPAAISTAFDNLAVQTGEGQNSYDYGMAEGTPLRALGWGKVIANGSRDRDLAWMDTGGTTYQGEVYIQYDIGSTSSNYRESYVAYYAHLRRRSVVDGQTVAPGQIIGYSGTSGSSGGPHLHFGLVRVTNTNATLDWTPAGLAYGHQVTYDADPTHSWGTIPGTMTGIVDPYGWRAPAGIDPYGHYWSRAKTFGSVIGAGAWGPSIWKIGEVPPYPG